MGAYYDPSMSIKVPEFQLRVFYLRLTGFSAGDHLSVYHTPVAAIEVNGKPSSRRTSSSLRRDRVDRKSGEATYISTDSVHVTEDTKFVVLDGDDRQLLAGVLQFCNRTKKWIMECKATSVAADPHIAELCIAGCAASAPVILSHTVRSGKKCAKDLPFGNQGDPEDVNAECWSNKTCSRSENTGEEVEEEEEGALSWFKAGVRVGVGIGLGICIGAGISAGILARAYRRATARTLNGWPV